MESVARRRLIAIAVLTVLFGAAVGVMYALWAEFVPGFFYTALGAWAVGVALTFVFIRSRIEVGGLGGAGRTTEIPTQPPVVPPTPDLPLVVEPSPSRPELLAPPPVAAPAGYVFRGHTLYQRGSEAKPIRFFSKKKGEVGTPIPLPAGFEAAWDAKKGKPVLRALKDESPLAGGAEEMEARVAGGDGRRCSAWTSIGIMCENVAREGGTYCAKHANYKPEQVTGQFVVNVPRGGASGKAVKGGLGEFQVRVGGKGVAKPLKLRAPEFEARIARPTVKGSRRALRMPSFEVAHDRRAMKPFKGVKAGEFEVSTARPSSKPLKLKEPKLVLRGPARPLVKPLRLREPELRIRSGAAPPPRPLRIREPNLQVRGGASPAAKPLRLREPNLNVRGPVAHAPKPMRVAEQNVLVRRSVGTPGKPLRLKEPNIQLRGASGKPAKPLRNIADAPMVVRKSGSLGAGKPFRLAEPKLEVKSGASKPPKPFKSNPSDILVERDSKKRSDVGVAGRPAKGAKKRGK